METNARHTEDEDTCVVHLQLTDEERIEYQKCAERCGLSLSEWMRDRLALSARREAKEG